VTRDARSANEKLSTNGLGGDQGIKGDLLEADFSVLIGGISSRKDSDDGEALKMK